MRQLMLIVAALLSASCGSDKFELWGKYAATQHKIFDRIRDPAVLEANTAAFFALKELGEIVEVDWSKEEGPSCARFLRTLNCQELEYGLRLVGGARPVRMDGGGSGYFHWADADFIARHLDFIRAHPVSFSAHPARDDSGLALTLRLSNNVGNPIVVDRDMRIGIVLVVSGVPPEAAAQPEKPIEFIRVEAEVASGLHDPLRSRFVSLEPGEYIERTISFSAEIACYRPRPGSGLPQPGHAPMPEEIVCIMPRSIIRSVGIYYDTTQRDLRDSLEAFTGRSAKELTLTPLRLAEQVHLASPYLYVAPARYGQPKEQRSQ